MAQVYIGRFNRYFEKLFNIKGGPALVDVEPAISPVIQVNNTPLEERYLVGLESFAAADAQPAVAGNFSAFMIRNPINSNVIMVIEKISVAVSVASGILLVVAGSNPADLATTVSNHNRADPRGRSVGTAITTRDAPAANPTTGFLQIGNFPIATVNQTLDLVLEPSHEIVLLPQIAMRVVANIANTQLTCTLFWRERPLETSELT